MNPRNYSFASLSRGGGYPQQAAPSSSPNMQGFSTGQRPKKANVNYTGTMVGNGKVANNGQKANVQVLWHYRLWSFQGRYTKLERFLAKNQLYSNEITKF
jgi:hypothetical protein